MTENNMRLPRIGVIKHPKEGDFFEVPPEIEALTGQNPKRLEVIFVSDKDEDIYQESYRRHTGKIVRCVGSGGVGRELVDVKEGKREERKCPCDYHKNKQCNLIGTLNVVIPGVSLAGVYTIYTRSFNSRMVIKQALQMLRKLYGRVEGVPVAISRVRIVTGKGAEKRQHWILNLSPATAVPAAEQPVNLEVPEGNTAPEQKDPVPPNPACTKDPLAGPMTHEQAEKINAMMISKGLRHQSERKAFFEYTLGTSEKSCVFAAAFLTKFDEYYAKWMATRKAA